MLKYVCGTLLVFHTLLVTGQRFLEPQTNTFNSSFKLSAEQITKANLSSELANNIEVALNYERSNWAFGSIAEDSFYTVPENFTASTPPGTLLKVEPLTNTTFYTLAPNLALSRILFTTETYKKTVVPASAYILWPFSPNLQSGSSKAKTVVFAHGASGEFGDCTPSHMRGLLYQFQATYALALAGFAVVAPDYQGLGINYTFGFDNTTGQSGGTRTPVYHPLIGNPSLANDLFYSREAALQAFPSRLSDEFVIMGHSEGGGAAWAAAERQVTNPVPGYLGTIAGSPAANFSAVVDLALSLGATEIPGVNLLAWAAQGIFPDFRLSDVLTPLGVARLELQAEIAGCQGVTTVLSGDSTTQSPLLRDGWHDNFYLQSYLRLSSVGGRSVAGPVFVIQGTLDQSVPEIVTTATVNATCSAHPESVLEYLVVNGTTHVPTLYATQREWLGWINARFDGLPVDSSGGCQTTVRQPFWPIDHYQAETNWFLELALDAYQTA
ncbi:secretory lipase [Diaporthe amygdali]|uniref:secretory lipase n=1 Tax=Phomopsis amygdali TaxID=1214568 RepID=UPI0022FE2F2A|nr:secretory lipase [Diaporthe amygdali]KAJ0125475.1 secretory lipase [Diaporthe amygdali]